MARLGRTYTITSYPTYLYFAPHGALLYRRFGTASSPAPYLKDLAAARQELANPYNLSHHQAEYARGSRDPSLLHDYLAKHQQLQQAVEPALIDTYAGQLPAKTFDRGADVRFILELGPTIGGRAFQLTHLSKVLIDSIYRVLSLAQRVAINNRMIRRTNAEAVATHSEALARQGASYAPSTWGTNYKQGIRSYASNMLEFYRFTKK